MDPIFPFDNRILLQQILNNLFMPILLRVKTGRFIDRVHLRNITAKLHQSLAHLKMSLASSIKQRGLLGNPINMVGLGCIHH
jgi:hypothetical protein